VVASGRVRLPAIRAVAAASSATSADIVRSREAAAELTRMSTRLRDVVGQFRY